MIKQLLFSDWHFMRWLRLILGVFLGVQAFYTLDVLPGMIAIFLLGQAVTNTGCCGAQRCAVPVSKNNPDSTDHVEFEELKPK